ncbi:hypothetical protein [Rubrivivax gelatinosus]|nr:hypothetical protein [Rubrivivax gelatinosus]
MINRYHGFKDPHTGETRFELKAFLGDPKAVPAPGSACPVLQTARPGDVQMFRQFAHWMFVDDLLADQFAPAQAFVSYWQAGFYEKKQLHLTYTMQHMATTAPGIVDVRERHWAGALK